MRSVRRSCGGPLDSQITMPRAIWINHSKGMLNPRRSNSRNYHTNVLSYLACQLLSIKKFIEYIHSFLFNNKYAQVRNSFNMYTYINNFQHMNAHRYNGNLLPSQMMHKLAIKYFCGPYIDKAIAIRSFYNFRLEFQLLK